jgi:carbamoyl-phosphate synthase large subunit
MRILFMGASRLVSLLERFTEAAAGLEIEVEMYSLEDSNPWHAIGAARLASLVPGPSFQAPEFSGWLLRFVTDNNIDIVIPNIDAATVALARTAGHLRDVGVFPVVSSLEVCEAMADKIRAEEVFRSLDLRVPDSETFPLLAKPRFGASSRGIVKLNDSSEMDFWRAHSRIDDYLLQSFVTGTELSIDAYVDQTGRTLGIVSRVRVVVSDGEVMVTQTERQPDAIEMTECLLRWGKWHGPLTVQVIYDGSRAWLLECNPRFGSGVTCSIKAGLAIPEWILRERLGLPLPTSRPQWRDGLCLTRSRKDHFVWLS